MIPNKTQPQTAIFYEMTHDFHLILEKVKQSLLAFSFSTWIQTQAVFRCMNPTDNRIHFSYVFSGVSTPAWLGGFCCHFLDRNKKIHTEHTELHFTYWELLKHLFYSWTPQSSSAPGLPLQRLQNSARHKDDKTLGFGTWPGSPSVWLFRANTTCRNRDNKA